MKAFFIIFKIKKIMAEKTTNTVSLDGLSVQELVYYEQAACVVCRKYENSSKNYDGTIMQNSKLYNEFTKYNDVHNAIVEELAKRLNNIK